MNLLVVSEKHGLLVVGVQDKLQVFSLNTLTLTPQNIQEFKLISLENEEVLLLLIYIRI